MDSQELYQRNLRDYYQDLERYGWIDTEISYTFNSEGFRCPEFDDSPGIMTLGCSHTQGVGLPLEQVWCWRVAHRLGLRLINLGVGGTSTDTAFRLGSYWIPRLRPRCVAMLSPCKYRVEMFAHEGELCDLLPGGKHHFSELNEWYRTWVYNEINSDMNQKKNILALHKICDDLDIKFVKIDILDLNLMHFATMPRARDLSHLGGEPQSYIADIMLDMIG